MEIDWAQVKKKTLWHYEELIKKILIVLDYAFVQEHYNHTMTEAAIYAARIQKCYLQSNYKRRKAITSAIWVSVKRPSTSILVLEIVIRERQSYKVTKVKYIATLQPGNFSYSNVNR